MEAAVLPATQPRPASPAQPQPGARLAVADVPFDLVVFGGTGDLAYRKLLPALFHCFNDSQVAAGSRVLAVALSDLSADAYQQRARQAIERALGRRDCDAESLARFVGRVQYQRVDATAEHGWQELAAQLEREPPSGLEHEGMGRELFALLRRSVGPAEAGASIFSRERAGAK